VKIIAIYNLKGGVGKTAAAVNLAYLAAAYGHPTLLWDLDPQAAATWCLGADPHEASGMKKLVRGKRPIGEHIRHTAFEHLDLIPAQLGNRHLDALMEAAGPGRLGELLAPCAEDYALAILDCPPSIGALTEQIFAAADLLVMPVIPSPLSVRAYEQVVGFLAKQRIGGLKLYPFLSMLDRRRRVHQDAAEQLPRQIKTLLRTAVPYAAAVEQMSERRAPLPSYDSASLASRAYEDLWQELSALIRP
jgi:cellulose biosynthesis protein BcsQ